MKLLLTSEEITQKIQKAFQDDGLIIVGDIQWTQEEAGSLMALIEVTSSPETSKSVATVISQELAEKNELLKGAIASLESELQLGYQEIVHTLGQLVQKMETQEIWKDDLKALDTTIRRVEIEHLPDDKPVQMELPVVTRFPSSQLAKLNEDKERRIVRLKEIKEKLKAEADEFSKAKKPSELILPMPK